MKYSIIIVAYKDYASLERCISLVRKREAKDYEILVWDNTPEEERRIDYPGADRMFPGLGVGFARGCNGLAKVANGETLI